MMLRKLGEECGMNALAVSQAVTRREARLDPDNVLQRAAQPALRMLNGKGGKA